MHLPLAVLAHPQALAVGIAIIAIVVSISAFFVFSVVMAIAKKSGGWLAAAIASGFISLLCIFGTWGVYYLGQKRLAAKAAAASSASSSASSPGAVAPAGSPAAKPGFQILASPDGKVSFELPSTWTSRKPSKETTLMSVSSPAGHSLVVVRIMKIDVTDTLAEQSQRQTNALEHQLKGPITSLPVSKAVGAYPAVRHVVEGATDHFNLVFHTADIDTPDAYYHVVLSTAKSRDATDTPMIDQVIESFTLTGDPATH